MKKIFSLTLSAILVLYPIHTLATETEQELPKVSSENYTEIVDEPAPPNVNETTPLMEENTSNSESSIKENLNSEEIPAKNDKSLYNETSAEEKLNNEENDNINNKSNYEDITNDKPSDGNTSIKTKSTEESLDESSEKSSEESLDESSEDTTKASTNTEKDISEDDGDNKLSTYSKDGSDNELDIDSEDSIEEDADKTKTDSETKEKDIPNHEHIYTYISNEDGTHTVKCTAPIINEVITDDKSEQIEGECNYSKLEECEYDEEGICIYCGYQRPKVPEAFNPSISLSITNQICTVNENNPVICLSISQKDYDIEYAQICFANYSLNKYVNVGLAQGKYFDHIAGAFVSTGSNGWYASPNITEEYSVGKYSVRSLYVRSTTGESVHYSIESGNLNEEFQNHTIEIEKSTPLGLIPDILGSKNNSPSPVIDYMSDEPIDDDSNSGKPREEIIFNDNPLSLESTPSENISYEDESVMIQDPEQQETIPLTPEINQSPQEKNETANSNSISNEKNTSEIKDEKKEIDSTSTDIQKQEKNTPLTKNNENTSTNNSKNNTTSSNPILDFFKKLFGWR